MSPPLGAKIEHRTVAKPAFPVEAEPDGPDLLRLPRTLGINRSAHAPPTPLFGRRIIL
jgi:hypothetical protein